MSGEVWATMKGGVGTKLLVKTVDLIQGRLGETAEAKICPGKVLCDRLVGGTATLSLFQHVGAECLIVSERVELAGSPREAEPLPNREGCLYRPVPTG